MPARQDDTSIGDDVILWRRILDDRGWWTTDPDGRIRPASVAFKDRQSNEVSMYIATLTSETEVLSKHLSHGIVRIKAGQIRAAGTFNITADEIPVEEDPAGRAHIVVSPSPNTKAARIMAQCASWVRLPAGVPSNTGIDGYTSTDQDAVKQEKPGSL